MGWLRDTPIAVVKAHAAMLGRLQASEALLAVQAVALGTQRKLKPSSLTAIIERLKRAADGGQRQRAVPVTPWGLAALGIGIGVTVVGKGNANGC